MKMGANKFPPGWTEEEPVAEDEAAYEDTSQTIMEIPNALVPKVRELIAKHTR